MPKNYTWDLTPLLSSDEDPKIAKERKTVELENYRFINKWKKRTDYLIDPKVLKKALDEYEVLSARYGLSGDAGYYFTLRSAQDENDPKIKAKVNQIEEWSRKILNDIQFFELNLAKIPAKNQKKFLTDKNILPYKHFLKKLFAQSKYLLSEPEEKILNLKSQTSYSNWVKMTTAFLAKEEREVLVDGKKKEKKTLESIMTLSSDRNKKVRDDNARALNDILEKWKEVATEELNSILANKKVDDELRGMTRPELSRLISDDIEPEIVDAVVESVASQNNISQRFYQLKAKLLGLPKLRYHERNVEYGSIDKTYSFKESVLLIQKVFGNLDTEFLEIFNGFLKNGQFDVFPKKGKIGGAACWGNLKSQPSYIILNYTSKLRDVITIAHETGHGINNELIRKVQNSLNFSTPTSTAEIASTFMEDFVLQEIAKEANEEERLSLMVTRLNDDVSTIFRQIACVKFEQELHRSFREKGYLATEEIGKLFQIHMSNYMGKSVEQSPGSENWWVYWGHIRRFFYNYSYASGLLISKSMQAQVKENPEFIQKVKYFLASGTSESPKNIFNNIGIDLTKKDFWEKGLLEIDQRLKQTEILAKKLGKI